MPPSSCPAPRAPSPHIAHGRKARQTPESPDCVPRGAPGRCLGLCQASKDRRCESREAGKNRCAAVQPLVAAAVPQQRTGPYEGRASPVCSGGPGPSPTPPKRKPTIGTGMDERRPRSHRKARATAPPWIKWISQPQWRRKTSLAVAAAAVVAGATYAMAASSSTFQAGVPQQQVPQVPQASASPGPAGSTLTTGAGDWPTFRRSAERTGNAAGFAVHAQDVTQLAEKWSQTVGEAVTSAVSVGDSVFVGSKDHGLYSFNADTGAIKWREQTKGAVRTLPSVGAGLLVFASDDGSVYALDAVTGKERWSHAGGYGASSPLVVETAQPGDTRIYVGGSAGNIDALDTSGNVKWSAATAGAIESSPAVKADVVYVGSGDGRVHAFDARTGATKWSFLTGGPVTATPAVDHDKVYVGSNDSKLYAIDVDTGVPLWSQATKGPIRASAAVGEVEGLPGPSVFVGSSDGALYGFDATTGQLRWSPTTFNGPITSSPALGLDVLFLNANDSVLAVSPINGAILWDASLTGARDTSPALAQDKVLATAGNTIHAFALGTPVPAQAPAPASPPAAAPTPPSGCPGVPGATCPRCAGSVRPPCPSCGNTPTNGNAGTCPSAPVGP
ncbi:hypothetical protein CTZ27_35335 [Streptomyces griseocarneus]|nr:hypothetical protein CTZ27_35335 [Streptomyces griseocarneus]